MPTTFNEKPNAGSIRAQGLQSYLNRNYLNQGGYWEYDRRIKVGHTDTQIAQHFGRTKQAVWVWRRVYLEEQARMAA